MAAESQRVVKIDLDSLRALTEDIESAVQQLQGFASIRELRARLVVDAGIELSVLVDDDSDVMIEFSVVEESRGR
jgi:hypothetical protein